MTMAEAREGLHQLQLAYECRRSGNAFVKASYHRNRLKYLRRINELQAAVAAAGVQS